MSRRCDLCDLEFDQCLHGLAEQKSRTLFKVVVQVAPSHVAHLPGCAHKGEDEDFSKWGEITDDGAWVHLCQTMPADGGMVSDLVTNSGSVIGLEISHVCKDCRAHGIW